MLNPHQETAFEVCGKLSGTNRRNLDFWVSGDCFALLNQSSRNNLQPALLFADRQTMQFSYLENGAQCWKLRSVPRHLSCLRAVRTIPLTSLLGFCSDMHCQLWDLKYCRQVCAFPNHVQSIEFTTGGPQSSCTNRMHLSSISSLIAKGLTTYVNKVFLFRFFLHLQKYLKACFGIVIMGYCV
jgi:hypothetical protein